MIICDVKVSVILNKEIIEKLNKINNIDSSKCNVTWGICEKGNYYYISTSHIYLKRNRSFMASKKWHENNLKYLNIPIPEYYKRNKL